MIKRLDLLKTLQDTLLIYAVNSALDDAVNDNAWNVGNCFVLTRLVPASEGFIAVYKRLHGQNSVYNTKHMFLRLATSICNIFRYVEYLADSSVSIVTRIRSGRARNLGSVTVSGRNCSFLIGSIRFLGPQKLPCNVQEMKLTSHCHLVSRLRMGGSVPPLVHTSLCCGA